MRRWERDEEYGEEDREVKKELHCDFEWLLLSSERMLLLLIYNREFQWNTAVLCYCICTNYKLGFYTAPNVQYYYFLKVLLFIKRGKYIFNFLFEILKVCMWLQSLHEHNVWHSKYNHVNCHAAIISCTCNANDKYLNSIRIFNTTNYVTLFTKNEKNV